MSQTGAPVYNVSPGDESLKMGHKTVAAAGTAEAIASSTACRSVLIQARGTNTQSVYIGTSAVPNTGVDGWELPPYGSIGFDCTNLSEIYVNSVVNGEGVNFLYW